MVYMLKKIGVTAILLITIVSFMAGSMIPASGQSDRTGGLLIYRGTSSGNMIAVPHEAGYMPMPPMPGHRHTSVVLDLTGKETGLVNSAATGPVMIASGGMVVYQTPAPDGNREFITGKMSVLGTGSDKPVNYSVRFFKYPAPNGMVRPVFDSYRMDPATFWLGDNGSSNFTFGGEILVMNKSIAKENVTSVISGLSNRTYNNVITAGQTSYHQAQVTGAATAFNFSLKWSNANDDMSLTVYTPDGHILGPYTDTSDGKKDGSINMEIDNSAGVADGTWIMKVTDTSGTGTDQYYLRTW